MNPFEIEEEFDPAALGLGIPQPQQRQPRRPRGTGSRAGQSEPADPPTDPAARIPGAKTDSGRYPSLRKNDTNILPRHIVPHQVRSPSLKVADRPSNEPPSRNPSFNAASNDEGVLKPNASLTDNSVHVDPQQTGAEQETDHVTPSHLILQQLSELASSAASLDSDHENPSTGMLLDGNNGHNQVDFKSLETSLVPSDTSLNLSRPASILPAEQSFISSRPRARTFTIRVVTVRRPGRRSRPGVKALRQASQQPNALSLPVTSEPQQPAPIPPGFQHDFAQAYGTATLQQLEATASTNSTNGEPLPSYVRDLFTHLSDLPQALVLINSLRLSLGLPKVTLDKPNRIAIIRLLARTRVKLYTDICAALTLPLAPEGVKGDAEEAEEKQKISLARSNLDKLGKALPKAFPNDRVAITAFLKESLEFGETDGKVVWQGGTGRVIGGSGGYRGKTCADAMDPGSVHVFVDHSNILFGLLHHLHSDYSIPSSSLPPKHLRTLCLPSLSLLLRRGRPTPAGTLHLVGSAPLHQDLDPLVRLGWEVSILKRVELYADEVADPHALELKAKPIAKVSKGEDGIRRYKEQCVDEVIQLKILQALNRVDKGVLVLATGDARGGQFNEDGFVGCVREAIARGWTVELWSFSSGLSRTWFQVAKAERWDGKFRIHRLDEWASELVEVQDEDVY